MRVQGIIRVVIVLHASIVVVLVANFSEILIFQKVFEIINPKYRLCESVGI